MVDPARRPSVDGLLAQLYGIADQLGENMEQPSVSDTRHAVCSIKSLLAGRN